MIFFLAAIFGACIGSFCNVLIIRMHNGRSLGGRSSCMHCHKTLAPQDLIPVLSWLLLGGKCRQCHTPIHLQYPLVELLGACIGVYAVWRGGDIAFTAAFLFVLLVITVVDLRWQLVPTGFVAAAGGALVLWQVAAQQSVLSALVGVFVVGGFLAACVWGSRGRWMGEGDPWVGAFIGGVLGWPLGPFALLCAFVIGGAVASVLLIARTVTRHTAVPFVPFLALGAIIVYACGGALLPLVSYVFT